MYLDQKKFNIWNRVISLVALFIAAFTYLMTIEPTASFWDCGEFIVSSYKLEVGHPPGNPVFQLIARFFTIFGNNMHAAVLVNAMSALFSAFTIFFLYLTIVFFAKRVVKTNEEGEYSVSDSILIFGSGLVGALVYCFSDTFWFSAVEAEVYAMSSFFTAIVIWCMTKWYEQKDRNYANRWIVLIFFLMGLSIGVHLLNLLALPAIVFMYYYKKREGGHYSFWEYVKIMLLSIVILGLLVFILVPYLPKIAGYFDLFFVNVLHLPFNSGAAFFVALLIGLCFWGLFKTLRTNKVIINTVLLCFTSIIIGFSIFSIVIIRSSVKTPTNENQPDNAFSLARYLSREQYGSSPLIYGAYFDAPFEIKEKKYWARVGNEYKYVNGPGEPVYKAEGKMLFPRMWSNDSKHADFYKSYTQGKGTVVPGAQNKKPTFLSNLAFFFDYQLGWMYWRYFMWNFAGRQNDIHSPSPGAMFEGNWESGIKAIDNLRLGNQDDAPACLKNNKAKNHYYFLPLILGLLGLFFQFDRDKRGWWLVFLTFFMTGIAIVLYLNQPPFQVRERDYAYAGSFYAFSIWVGLALMELTRLKKYAFKEKHSIAINGIVTIIALFVPVLMMSENWDDHDRSNRYTAVEVAKNYLNSVGPNGILVTHGDNDTFPLWYAQEVENVRTDVRICNTSLLGTDWHIDQMKYACNQSAPLNLSVGREQYLYGTNEFVIINDTRNQVIPISDVMKVFRHPDVKIMLNDGSYVDYIISRKLSIPVNKENALKSGIVDKKLADRIPDNIVIEIPKNKRYLTKPELFMLDLLSNYQWDRPLNLLSMGGDINIGIKDYLMYAGFSYKLVPFKTGASRNDVGLISTDELYSLMTKSFTWEALSRKDYFVDYFNNYTFLGLVSQRLLFANAAEAFLKAGEKERALEMLDKCQVNIPKEVYPLETIPIGFLENDLVVIRLVECYYKLGEKEKARKLAKEYIDEFLPTLSFYTNHFEYSKEDFEICIRCSLYLNEVLTASGEDKLAEEFDEKMDKIVRSVS